MLVNCSNKRKSKLRQKGLSLLYLSIHLHDCRLRHFEIYYNDWDTSVEDVRKSVADEFDGPGKPLGYWAMQKKIRQKYECLECLERLGPCCDV